MRIDAHQHFWSLERGDYGWLTPALGPIYRDFGPPDLQPLLQGHGIDGTVLVQAAPTDAETAYMLGLATTHDFVKGVVGWVDFERSDAPAAIAKLAQHPKLVGLRPMIQDIDDTDWMMQPALTPAFEALIAHDLVFDALTLPRHLPNLRRLLARHPDLKVVIDHGSKPDIAGGGMSDWADDIAAIARDTQAFVKLSGLVTEAAPDWTAQDLAPVTEHLLTHFGPTRMIWGSDWPVCTLASTYDDWVSATDTLLATLSTSDRAAILGLNATRFYNLS
ncbi:amidohydrolase family protein [Tateyamaria sp. SN3-11]|uniref:amidohydrolase family protein n=1 Tax=Tateyamaria sp. SN3-11 TaxID=3092147 RepID=UPI0039EB2C23